MCSLCSCVTLGLPCRRSSEDPVRPTRSLAATTRLERPGDSRTRSIITVGQCLHMDSLHMVHRGNLCWAVRTYSISCRLLALSEPLICNKTMSKSWRHVKKTFLLEYALLLHLQTVMLFANCNIRSPCFTTVFSLHRNEVVTYIYSRQKKSCFKKKTKKQNHVKWLNYWIVYTINTVLHQKRTNCPWSCNLI